MLHQHEYLNDWKLVSVLNQNSDDTEHKLQHWTEPINEQNTE